MSERGSFVTQYIYCPKCLAAAEAVLLQDNKGLKGVRIPVAGNFGDGLYPIIAGKVGGLFGGEELQAFESELIPALEPGLCHPLRIAVLAEEGEAIYTAQPKTKP